MNIDNLINGFIQQSIQLGDLEPLDVVYVTNKLLALLRKEDYKETMNEIDKSRLALLDGLVEYAVTEEIIEDLDSARDIFSSQIMDLVTPRPSEINHSFWTLFIIRPK